MTAWNGRLELRRTRQAACHIGVLERCRYHRRRDPSRDVGLDARLSKTRRTRPNHGPLSPAPHRTHPLARVATPLHMTGSDNPHAQARADHGRLLNRPIRRLC